MATSTTRAADEIADSIKALIDRVVDAKVTQEVTRRGQGVAGLLAERGAELGAELGERAEEAWRDSRPLRRDTAKRLARATDDAAKWSDHAWHRSIRPFLRDLWSQRTAAAGAAGAALPVGRELVDTAASRLGIRRRQEERHWGAFFIGLLVGAAAGAIVALLTTPKRGDEVRREVAQRADEVRREVAHKADEISAKAREEWVPLFQSGTPTNGHAEGGTLAETSTATGSGTLENAAADAGTSSGEVPDAAASETAEAINESYESVDRESTT